MANFAYDPGAPLEKRKGETPKSNRALLDYYKLGPGRSFAKLMASYQESLAKGIKPPTTTIKSLESWSSRYDWQKRIQTQAKIDADIELAQYSQWARETRQADWNQAKKLRELADKVLDEGPNFIRQSQKIIKGVPDKVDRDGKLIEAGEPDQVFVYMALDANTAIKSAETGSKLARLASGLNTESAGVNLSGDVSITREVIDYDQFSDSELARLLNDAGGLFLEMASRITVKRAKGKPDDTDQDPAQEGNPDP